VKSMTKDSGIVAQSAVADGRIARAVNTAARTRPGNSNVR